MEMQSHGVEKNASLQEQEEEKKSFLVVSFLNEHVLHYIIWVECSTAATYLNWGSKEQK